MRKSVACGSLCRSVLLHREVPGASSSIQEVPGAGSGIQEVPGASSGIQEVPGGGAWMPSGVGDKKPQKIAK